MSNDALKDIFTFTANESEKIIVISVSIILFLICSITAALILPENCSLFSDNIPGGLQCDALTIPYVPCGCQDRRMASVATIITGLGVSFFFLPFIVYVLRNRRNYPSQQTKLFD